MPMTTVPPFIGRYINLDRSVDRREAVEAQLRRRGVADRYARFSAVDGDSLDIADCPLSRGQLGCFLSHQRLIREHATAGLNLHIVEDDVIFGPRSVPLLDLTIPDGARAFDVIYSDISVLFNLLLQLSLLRAYRASGMVESTDGSPASGPWSIIYQPLNGPIFMGATSYIVSGRSIARLADALDEEVSRGPRRPIDVFYQQLFASGAFTAACTVPFLTSLAPPARFPSTIAALPDTVDRVAYLLRAPFFMDRDDAAISRLLEDIGAPDPGATGPGALAELMRYLFSDRFALPWSTEL
jgi:hypothetical protein